MESLNQVGRLLDTCLTTDLLVRIYPTEKLLEENKLEPSEVYGRHKFVQIQVVEQAGKLLEERLNRSLSKEELFLLCNRVDQFLIARGYTIKNFYQK